MSTVDPATDVLPTSPIGDMDLYLFNEGSHLRLYEALGAHPTQRDGEAGTHFAVWAPNAASVSVVGDFNGWDAGAHPMQSRGISGIWEAFVPGIGVGEIYKYHVVSGATDHVADKADPFAFHAQEAPDNASKVWDLTYDWDDAEWMARRGGRQAHEAPISIYELHLGSWRRGDDPEQFMTYRDLADPLIEHVTSLGFTHVEFLPVMEHPFYGSWGYQSTGYFAPTSRYGTPQDFMYLVDRLHQADIGVILDWVPSHFPTDEFALGYFDGTHLFEHADPRQGFHPDWSSFIFNYSRKEVQSFLLSSALFWLETYHIDGIRVDAVASMLYLDYSRKEGEWIPNQWGGNENVEAIDFLRRLNTEIYAAYPDVQTFAEESTAWPMVSRPAYIGGLGFGFKWDMGWMNDTLRYMSEEPVNRKYHHDQLTFRSVYAFAENYCMPLSHDEVVHGKGALLDKMPGDDWQRRANLRLLWGTCSPSPARSCSSWAASSDRNASGTTTSAWTGTSSRTRGTPGCSGGCPTSPACTGANRHCTSWTRTPRASSGSTHPTGSRASSRTCGAVAGRVTCWWPATSRRCPGTTTGSGSRTPGSGASSRTPTPRSTAAPARATWEASSPRRCPATDGWPRSASRSRRCRWSSSAANVPARRCARPAPCPARPVRCGPRPGPRRPRRVPRSR